MIEKFSKYDPANVLETDEDIAFLWPMRWKPGTPAILPTRLA